MGSEPPSTPGRFTEEGRLYTSVGYHGEATIDGLVDLRARQYAPAIGRFLTKDPLSGEEGTVSSANPYAYSRNDPLNVADPTGWTAVSDASFGVALTAKSVNATGVPSTNFERDLEIAGPVMDGPRWILPRYRECFRHQNVCIQTGITHGQIYLSRAITNAIYSAVHIPVKEKDIWHFACGSLHADGSFGGSTTVCERSLLAVKGDFVGSVERGHREASCLSMKFDLLSTLGVANIGTATFFTFDASAEHVLRQSTWIAGDGYCHAGSLRL